jgi:hypothetical protein
MEEVDLEVGFTGCDTAVLNRSGSSGRSTSPTARAGNTKQRNLRHLFTWLADAYGHSRKLKATLPPESRFGRDHADRYRIVRGSDLRSGTPWQARR